MDRVRKMYASFDSRPQRGNSPQKATPEPNREPSKPVSKPAPVKESSPAKQSDKIAQKNENGLLEILMKDQDQSLILLLLVLLMKDGADMNLMLALIYILL